VLFVLHWQRPMGAVCLRIDRRRRRVDERTCCLLEDGRGAALVGSNLPSLFICLPCCHGSDDQAFFSAVGSLVTRNVSRTSTELQVRGLCCLLFVDDKQKRCSFVPTLS
jgi:hypothetical protein